eukprot:7360233-Ditylum_brightwellii.AAC.1
MSEDYPIQYSSQCYSHSSHPGEVKEQDQELKLHLGHDSHSISSHSVPEESCDAVVVRDERIITKKEM